MSFWLFIISIHKKRRFLSQVFSSFKDNLKLLRYGKTASNQTRSLSIHTKPGKFCRWSPALSGLYIAYIYATNILHHIILMPIIFSWLFSQLHAIPKHILCALLYITPITTNISQRQKFHTSRVPDQIFTWFNVTCATPMSRNPPKSEVPLLT